MDCVNKPNDLQELGLKNLYAYLKDMKTTLDKSEEQYQFETSNPNDPSYMSNELKGTLRFDYITEDMIEHTENTLKKLNLEVGQAREIVFKVTGVRL